MNITLKTLEEAEICNRKVLVRVDFNVPLDKQSGDIADDTRLVKAIPTIKFIASQGGRIVLLSHLGRPKIEADKKFYSLEKLVPALQKLLPESKVSFLQDPFDTQKINEMGNGEVLLAENIRFFPEEVSEDENIQKEFAQKLASGFDLYVNDAFSVSHRDHASVTRLPRILPGYPGFLLKKEIEVLTSLQQNIARPYVAVIGGAKVSTKLKMLKSLIKKVDSVLIGGAMTYTFLKSRALEIGNSKFEKEYLSAAFQIIDEALYHKKEFLLPIDHMAAQEISEQAKCKVVKKNIPDGLLGVDIGPKTLKSYIKTIQSAKTIFWNGPMGIFEIPQFSKGTVELAKAIAKTKATSIVGGGDSIHALKIAGVKDKITHISTGGGAALKFLEGDKLPGLAALEDEG